jgi:hypothetical protein
MENSRSSEKAEYYRFQVKGHIDQRWLDWFDGFDLQYLDEDTIILGEAIDQAALHGVLAKIRDLGLPIILVEKVQNECSNDTDP